MNDPENSDRQDALRWRKLLALCAHAEVLGGLTVGLRQGAQREECVINVGTHEWHYAPSLAAALDNAMLPTDYDPS